MNVDASYKGKKLNMKLIRILKAIAELYDCYKIVLDCADHNIAFYELVRLQILNSQYRMALSLKKDACVGIDLRVDCDYIH